MTWTTVVSAPKPHECNPPATREFLAQHGQGSVLRCDTCGQHWVRSGFPAVFAWSKTGIPDASV